MVADENAAPSSDSNFDVEHQLPRRNDTQVAEFFISTRLRKRGNDAIFDNVVHGDKEWESSFSGAIPMARQLYGETLKKLLANLVADPGFKKAC